MSRRERRVLPSPPSPLPLRLLRILIVSSALLAVAAGLAPLAGRPALLASLAATVAGALLLARTWPHGTATLVLAGSYVSYGIVRLTAGAEAASMPFFLAAFAGLALGSVSWTTWHAPRGWRLPLAWWAGWVALSWPVVAWRELGYTVSLSPSTAPIVMDALLHLALALWIDRWLAPWAEPAPHPATLVPVVWQRAFIASAALTSAAAVYQHWWDPAWLSGEPWIGMRRSVGLMGDGNPMGVAAALWAPLAIAADRRTMPAAAGAVALALLLWTAAWTSGGRTMLLLTGAGLVGLSLTWAVRRQWSGRRMAAGIGAVLAGGSIVLLLVAPRVSSSSPLGRLLWATPQSLGGAIYEMAWRREGYGLAAAAAIREHPIAGVGIGRFRSLSTGYVHRLTGRTIPPDNAQNLWRHTLVEQGVIGLVPLLWLTGLTASSLLRTRPSGSELVVRVMLVALGVSLLVGYPVQDPAIAVTLATLVACVGRPSGA